MTENDLRKFDKEALVQCIYADSVGSRERTLENLRRYQKRVIYNKLLARSEKIGEQLRNFKFADGADMTAWDALFKERARIQKKINKILGE